MKKDILLSIICPAYNVGNQITKMVESLEKQNYKGYELILVNDGSTDNTLKVIKGLEKKYNNIIVVDKENSGAGYSRNAGLQIAKGKYIAFADGDDYYEDNFFDKIIPEIEKEEFELLVFNANIKNDGKVTGSLISKKFKEGIFEFNNGIISYLNGKFSYQIGNVPWNKIYSKSIIDKYNLEYCNKRKGQDLVFNVLYVSKIKSFRYLNCNLYNYELNFDLVKSSSYRKDAIENILLFYDYFFDICKKNNIENVDSYIGLFYLNRFPEVLLNEVNNDSYKDGKNNLRLYLKDENVQKSIKAIKLKQLNFKLFLIYIIYKLRLYNFILYILHKKNRS